MTTSRLDLGWAPRVAAAGRVLGPGWGLDRVDLGLVWVRGCSPWPPRVRSPTTSELWRSRVPNYMPPTPPPRMYPDRGSFMRVWSSAERDLARIQQGGDRREEAGEGGSLDRAYLVGLAEPGLRTHLSHRPRHDARTPTRRFLSPMQRRLPDVGGRPRVCMYDRRCSPRRKSGSHSLGLRSHPRVTGGRHEQECRQAEEATEEEAAEDAQGAAKREAHRQEVRPWLSPGRCIGPTEQALSSM